MNYSKRTRNSDKRMVLYNLKGILGVLKIPLDNNIISNFMKIYYAKDEAYLRERNESYLREFRNVPAWPMPKNYNKQDYMSQELQDLLIYFQCYIYNKNKTIKHTKKKYGCNDNCKNCISCLYGYTIETIKETNIRDGNLITISTEDMRKHYLSRQLISMIFVRFGISKDIRKLIFSNYLKN